MVAVMTFLMSPSLPGVGAVPVRTASVSGVK